MASRLLVLDDEPDLLFLYQLILEPEGYDVHIAASGFEQATDIEHLQPDLLILDYHMSQRCPGEGPLLQQLRAYPPTSALPVILCTADAYAIAEQKDFLRAHRVGMLLKPFEIADLVALVRNMLQEATEPTAPATPSGARKVDVLHFPQTRKMKQGVGRNRMGDSVSPGWECPGSHLVPKPIDSDR